ncbi:MAG TPA: hypothetical protein VFO10_28635 [Oligoflexus sp.]|uniref:hypothetical protein n=1 Tax=Oligoflexus sp. TaxID=1971216 RepID=UPI002D7FE253|nr:hypothetical protein [Oligoflexus sp.]HET9241266.1 hypothetical protein [Oligoflexus sp.]
MARTRALVESDLAKASKLMKDFEAKLGGKPDKKTLRHDAGWRRLRAQVDKYKNQLHFIDKRNKKPEPKA